MRYDKKKGNIFTRFLEIIMQQQYNESKNNSLIYKQTIKWGKISSFKWDLI